MFSIFIFICVGTMPPIFLDLLCYLKLNRLLYFNFDYLHKHRCLLLWTYYQLIPVSYSDYTSVLLIDLFKLFWLYWYCLAQKFSELEVALIFHLTVILYFYLEFMSKSVSLKFQNFKIGKTGLYKYITLSWYN